MQRKVGALAGARGAEQHEELAVVDVERQVAHRVHGAELLADVVEGYGGHVLLLLASLASSLQAAWRSDTPLRLSKNCVRAASSPIHTASPWPRTNWLLVRARRFASPMVKSTMS